MLSVQLANRFNTFIYQLARHQPSSSSLMWFLLLGPAVSNIFLYKAPVCPYTFPRAVPSVTQTERVHLSFPIYATLFSPSTERGDGWQLFVDSMPRLISSACLLGCQHSALSEVGAGALLFQIFLLTLQHSWSLSGRCDRLLLNKPKTVSIASCLGYQNQPYCESLSSKFVIFVLHLILNIFSF